MITIKKPTKEEVDLITFDEEIYSRAMDDSSLSIDEIKNIFPYEDFYFLGCYLNDKIIGLASIYQDGFHFEILKPYRKHARKCLELCLNELPRPLFCEIPTLFQSVINFAKKAGFIEQGYSDRIYIKNKINYKMVKLCLK